MTTTMSLHFNKMLSSSLLLLLVSQVLSYPVFGTKRYGRSSGALPPNHRESTYSNLPLHASNLNQYLPPPSYYVPPYAPNYEMDYSDIGQDPVPYTSYNPMSAPLYYSTNTNDNLGYGLYPSLVPAYYDPRRSAYYYGGDESISPVDDIHEEMQDDEREDALPIGEGTWYENGGQRQLQAQESIADVNAAFLRNLILSQMYSDVQNHENPSAYRGEPLNEDWYYDEPRQQNARYYSESGDYEDEDVRELKSLAKKTGEFTAERLNRVPRQKDDTKLYGKPVYNPSSWNGPTKKRSMAYGTIIDNPMNARANWMPMAFAESLEMQAPVDSVAETTSSSEVVNEGEVTSTTVASEEATTTAPEFDSRRGQKEVPLLRPATARHRPAEDSMGRFMVARSVGETATKTAPNQSVYDTIKHLLSLDHGPRKDSDDAIREQPHKRFVSNEESLVDQLGGLKKLAS